MPTVLCSNPDAFVTYRDLARNNIPQFSGALANIASVPVEQRSAELQRDALDLLAVLEEVLVADFIVIGAPMYNFGIPSQLKSWLDALAVPGKTFQHDATGFKGLFGAKRVVIASARGGLYGAETPMAAFDHQETYLRSFFGFLGVTRLEVVRAEVFESECRDEGSGHGCRSSSGSGVAGRLSKRTGDQLRRLLGRIHLVAGWHLGSRAAIPATVPRARLVSLSDAPHSAPVAKSVA